MRNLGRDPGHVSKLIHILRDGRLSAHSHPVVVLFLIVQRSFAQGIATTGTKPGSTVRVCVGRRLRSDGPISGGLIVGVSEVPVCAGFSAVLGRWDGVEGSAAGWDRLGGGEHRLPGLFPGPDRW